MAKIPERMNPAGGQGSRGGGNAQNVSIAYCIPAELQFLEAMRAEGISPSDPTIIADGELHRFHIEGDKQGTRNGWYVLHLDGIPSGKFGSWRAGIARTWSAKRDQPLSPRERIEHLRRIDAAKKARAADLERKHRQAATKAASLWSQANPAPVSHPYLVRKGVRPYTARILGGDLVLPVVAFDDRMAGLQFISPEGGKRLLLGTAKKGSFIPVARGESARVMICEGFATGATLAESDPQARVIAAIDAGNLEPVAIAARRRWPDAELVIACDFDPVGREKGYAAAIASGALLMPPPLEIPEGVTDWNDLAHLQARKGAQ